MQEKFQLGTDMQRDMPNILLHWR